MVDIRKENTGLLKLEYSRYQQSYKIKSRGSKVMSFILIMLHIPVNKLQHSHIQVCINI